MANIMNIGISALLAQQRALAVTANNIANANTPGYARQRIELSERTSNQLGGQSIGTGVDLARIRRMSDEFSAAQMRSAASSFHRADTFSNLASVVENMLADEQLGLGSTLQSFVNALQGVANDPASTSARQAFLSEARTLVARFTGMDDRLADMDAEVGQRLGAVTAEINSIGASLADINSRVVSVAGSSKTPPHDLLDQRDALLERLSELVDIQTVAQDDGTTSVLIGSGQALVLGATSARLEAVPGRFDPHQPEVVLRGVGDAVTVTQFMTGGEVGALLDFRREMLAPTRAAIGQLAVGLADAANAAHMQGMDLRGELGQALFGLESPAVFAASSNSSSAVPSVSVADVAALRPQSYRVHFDGGAYRVYDGASGAEVSASGAGTAGDPLVVDGLEIVFGLPPAAGDEFAIRALEGAAGGLSLLVQNPDRVAAAAPVRARAATGNAGDAAVALKGIVDPANPALTSTATIEFTGATTYSVDGAGSFTFTPGDEIVVNGARIALTGTPAVGDRFIVESNAGGVGDNRNAFAMIDALGAGVLDGGTTTLQGAVGRVVAQVGTLTSEAQNRSEAQAAVLEQSRARLDSVRGVNLDEEAAEMLRAEQMYQAAAQTISVANSLFDSLLMALRG